MFQEYICYNRASDFEWKVGTSVVHATLLLFAVVIAPMQCKRCVVFDVMNYVCNWGLMSLIVCRKVAVKQQYLHFTFTLVIKIMNEITVKYFVHNCKEIL